MYLEPFFWRHDFFVVLQGFLLEFGAGGSYRLTPAVLASISKGRSSLTELGAWLCGATDTPRPDLPEGRGGLTQPKHAYLLELRASRPVATLACDSQ
jgi:hypothetical protein